MQDEYGRLAAVTPGSGGECGAGGDACDAVVSPELVLVSPDLRDVALARLPERDPYAFLVFERSKSSGLKPAVHRLSPLRGYGDLLANQGEPRPSQIALFADYSEFLAADSKLEPAPRLRRHVLVSKAAAYAFIALTEFLFTWGFVVGTLVVAAALILWVA